MSVAEWLTFGLVTPLCTGLFLHLAPRLGLVDRPSEAPERKLQARPVPAVGGLALVMAALVFFGISRVTGDPGSLWQLFEPGAALAILLAFSVGLVDDLLRAGLSPLQKVTLQGVAALPLVWLAPGIEGWALWFAGIAAMNVVNTFDNSDGCLTALCAAALWPLSAAVALGLTTFLPFNLGRAPLDAPPGDPRRLPARAYLGDAGSHMLGMLLLFFPGAWLTLVLPAFDLARVCVLRWAAGTPPWEGDRRHLAHRFEDRGWPPWAIALSQVAIAAPAIFVGTSGAAEDPFALFAGVSLTGILFGLAVLVSQPQVDG